jgi:biofilm protein TabA
MILDSISNIDIYKNISGDIYAGLVFIKNAKADIAVGEYKINDKVKAIVSEYDTVKVFERGYEAHKHVIDIQFPIRGLERVKWSPIEGMIVNTPYDSTKDRTFYKNPSQQGIHVDIGNGIFAVMFPEDGHSPQHLIEKTEYIKKITVKVSI